MPTPELGLYQQYLGVYMRMHFPGFTRLMAASIETTGEGRSRNTCKITVLQTISGINQRSSSIKKSFLLECTLLQKTNLNDGRSSICVYFIIYKLV